MYHAFCLFVSEENRAVLAQYGKNYLPLLFNLFTTEPENPSRKNDRSRLSVLETIKTYLLVADGKVCDTWVTII